MPRATVAGTRPAATPGPAMIHGTLQRGVVDEQAVGALAVLAEALAVVGGHEHERARERPLLFERAQEPRDLRVHERDLAVVGRGAEPLGQLAGRLVGRVRVVVVHPQEERARRSPRGAAQPAQRGVGGGVGEALDVGRAPRVVAARQVVVVGLEAAVEPEAAVEREARRRRRPSGSRPARKSSAAVFTCGRQHVAAVVAHAVAERGEAGQDATRATAR